MSDLINRQSAVDIVLEYAKRLREPIGTPEDNEMYSYGRGLLIGIERNLKQLPSVDWAWIPVSEMLPKKEGEVLVTTSWGNVCMAWCDNGKWRAEYINGYDDDEILAWMPLPEPYMAESEDKE